MAKRASKAAPKAKPKKDAQPEAISQGPKDSARSELGQLTEELFAACYASLGSKSAKAAAQALGLSEHYGKILLARPSVKAMIAAHVGWQVEHLKANGLRLISEAWLLARSDISEVIVRKGNRVFIKDDELVPAYTNKAIRKITCKIEEKIERQSEREKMLDDEPTTILKTEITVEMHDKVGAMNLLAKHLGVEKPQGVGGEGKKTWLDFMQMCANDGPG